MEYLPLAADARLVSYLVKRKHSTILCMYRNCFLPYGKFPVSI